MDRCAASPQFREALCLAHCNIVRRLASRANAPIGSPVHSARLLRKWIKKIRGAPKQHPDLSRPADVAKMGAFGLAGVSKAEASPAREDRCGTQVKHGHASLASPAGAAEPGPVAAKMAPRQRDRHALIKALPVTALVSAGEKTQNRCGCVWLNSHTDAAGGFAGSRPRTRERVACPQQAFSLPVPHIDCWTDLAGWATAPPSCHHDAPRP